DIFPVMDTHSSESYTLSLHDALPIFKTGSERKNLSQSCLMLGRSLFIDLTQKIEKLVVNVQPFCFILIGFCVIGMYLKLLMPMRSEEHTSELQSRFDLVCRLLLEKKK